MVVLGMRDAARPLVAQGLIPRKIELREAFSTFTLSKGEASMEVVCLRLDVLEQGVLTGTIPLRCFTEREIE